MKAILNFIRNCLGSIIVFFDVITRPKPLKRSEEDQKEVDEQTKHLALYQFKNCPFCTKVRRNIHKLNLNIELRDAKIEQYAQELTEGGGRRKVPCLRMENNGQTEWMYQSNDIITFLNKAFNPHG